MSDGETGRSFLKDLSQEELEQFKSKYFPNIQAVEQKILDEGMSGWEEFLTATDKSLRQLEKDLGVPRQLLARVYDVFGISRLSHSEASAKTMRNLPPLSLERQIERNKKLSEANKRRWEDPEMRQRNIESMRLKQLQPEVKQKKSEITRNLWKDPEQRAKRSDSIRRVTLEQWQDPEIRRRHMEGLRKYHDTRALMKPATVLVEDDESFLQAEEPVQEDQSQSEPMSSNVINRKSHRNRSRITKSDEELSQLRSEIARRTYEDPEQRAKILAGLKRGREKASSDPEIQAKRLERLREAKQDPEKRARQAAAARETAIRLNADPEHWKKVAEGVRKARANPEYADRYYLPTIHGFRKDIGYYANSAWEANVARVFSLLGREYYVREPVLLSVPNELANIFKSGVTQYCIDFIVVDPRGNMVAYDIVAHPIEDPVGLAKVALFNEQYPQIPLHVVDERTYERIEQVFADRVRSNKKFIGWEDSNFNLRTQPDLFK